MKFHWIAKIICWRRGHRILSWTAFKFCDRCGDMWMVFRDGKCVKL